MKTIILGVSGSIASYRAADLCRDLMRAGFRVRVCLTDAAQEFVSRTLFETLTGEPCLVGTFEEPVPGRMAHIDWAREADLVLIAPATANTINRIAFGLADDMLTTIALASERPLVVAPAMNPSMFANEKTQEALGRLASSGASIIEPDEGDVASGEQGLGKLAQNAKIVEQAIAIANRTDALAGQRVLITSGASREPLDSVRFLSNESTGRMGAALAQAALWMGAEVTICTGPSHVPTPRLAQRIPFTTASSLLEATKYVDANWIVGCAAVSDYRPAEPLAGKRRRTVEPWDIRLIPNPDVIAELAAKGTARVVGFAAEPSADVAVAKEKLLQKKLFAIAANDVSNPAIGFGSDENELQLLFADGAEASSGRMSKIQCALWLWEQLTSKARS